MGNPGHKSETWASHLVAGYLLFGWELFEGLDGALAQ
jgi:hypothetical protein